MAIDGKITVALVGGGTIAPLHAEYLISSPTCSLVAILDPFAPGKKLAEKLSVPHFESVSALLASPTCSNPDAYVICVPSGLHVQVGMDVISVALPKAVLVEKPFSTDSESGIKLVKLAREKSCCILVGHHRRFHPSLTAAREAIENGRLGEITMVSGYWTAKKNDGYYNAAQWRCSRSGGGGPIWTNFVHDIDALHYLTGARVTRVWAIPTVRRRRYRGVTPDDIIDEGAAIMLQLSNGVVGTFAVSDNVASPYGWESATGDNPLYPPASTPVDSYRIFGTNGSLSIPDDILWTYDPKDAQRLGLEIGWNVPMQREALSVLSGIPFERQTEHLGRVVKGTDKPRCSGEDGLAAVRVCEAVMEALTVGDGVPIDISP
ncbi:hypothetical protein BDV59DRAFT_194612 [Aspergillus ambiguus]|uniref:Gfo/Idh/MocA family protein n=1 Tax=Aspergillus ambiguus TaxID=176160 RepID=UPI003CCCE79A